MRFCKKIKEIQNKYIPNYDYLFEDKIFMKGFLEQLIKTCTKLKEESENKFDFIFENLIEKKNTSIIIDYNILSISFISFMINNYRNDDFYEKIVQTFIKNKEYYDKILLISLARRNIVDLNFNKLFYSRFVVFKNEKAESYVLDFKGIVIIIDQITTALDDENLIIEFSKLINENYRIFFEDKKNKHKKYTYFTIEESKLFEIIFKGDAKNDN